MTVPVLQEFTSGDTNYIAKLNANYGAIASFMASLEISLNSLTGGTAMGSNAANIGKATYGTGTGMSFVGSGSFAHSESGTLMTLAGGFCWDSTLGVMNYQAGPTTVDFAGAVPGTYYIRFDGNSTPYRDTLATGAIYSVVWAGASFTSVTQLATVTPAAPDIGDLASSYYYSGITYLTPQARLEATEKAFSDILPADMAPGDYTPAVASVMEAVGIRLTGALTANRTLTVPSRKKLHLIRNECTGAFTVTIKTLAGTGVALASGENAVLYCDSVNVIHILRQGADHTINTLLSLLDTPDSFDGNALKVLRVRADMTGMEFVAPSSMLTANLSVADEGTVVDAAVSSIDFVGGGVAVTETAPGQLQVTVPGTAIGVLAAGASVDGNVVTINFEGGGVTVTQDSAGHVTVSIPGTGASAPADYDVPFFIADKRPAGAVAFRHTFTRAVDFPANFAGSDADAVAGATASAVWTVKKNGTAVGTVTFAAGASVATFATSGAVAVSFAAGDILEVVAPSPQDATLSGVSITFSGVRG